jgi:hypothetical protein
VSVPDDLLEEVRETARLTHLSVQDVFRQSVKIARPVLRASASPKPPQRLSLWDALQSGHGLELKTRPMKGTVKKTIL